MLSVSTCSSYLYYYVDCRDDGVDVVGRRAVAVVDFLGGEIRVNFHLWNLFPMYYVVADLPDGEDLSLGPKTLLQPLGEDDVSALVNDYGERAAHVEKAVLFAIDVCIVDDVHADGAAELEIAEEMRADVDEGYLLMRPFLTVDLLCHCNMT